MSRATKKSATLSRRQGFTLIEIMVSLAIAGTALVAIFSMQESVARGNALSREMSTATAATRIWVERLKRDTLLWTGVTPNGHYLKPENINAGWRYLAAPEPIQTTGGGTLIEAPAFDWMGNETTQADEQHFCTIFRLSWVRMGETLRADVITWWNRRGATDCAESDTVVPRLVDIAEGFRHVAASIVLRRNPQ